MTTTITQGNQPARRWHLIDLSGLTLGRVATTIAPLLMGKNLTSFSYHRDDGDYVVAINAAKIKVTGHKLRQKLYQSYSGFPGGLKELTLAEMLKKDPSKVIHHAVAGMLPKNRLRDPRLARLRVFNAATHPYAAHLK